MAKTQVYWEDVEVGTQLPTLAKIATTQTLVKWAGATGDFVPLHYDEGFAKSQGLPNLLVHGLLKQAWLIQLVTNWMGDDGTLKKFSCQYRGMDFPRPMKSFTEPQRRGDLAVQGEDRQEVPRRRRPLCGPGGRRGERQGRGHHSGHGRGGAPGEGRTKRRTTFDPGRSAPG